LLLLCFVISWEASGQSPFSKMLPLGDIEEIRGIKKVEGGYLLHILANVDTTFFWPLSKIAKVDEAGELLWHGDQDNGIGTGTPHNGSSNQSCHVHMDGTCFFIGPTKEDAFESIDFFLFRTDAEGNTLWSRTYGSVHEDIPLGITALNDSTILAYGDYAQSFGDDEYLWIMALDLDGELRWERFYKDDGYPTVNFKDLSVLDNGDIVMLYRDCDGISDCGASTQKRLRLAYLDAEGNRLWASTLREYRILGHPAELLLPLDNGQFLVASHREVGIGVDRPPTLYWVSPEGEVVQQYDFPYENLLYILDLFLSSSGDIIGCGSSDGYIDGVFYGAMAWVFSMTQDGQMNWERLVYDNRPPFYLGYVAAGVETADKGFLFGGVAGDTVLGVGTNWLLKLDSLGCYEPGCGDIQFVDVQELLPAPRPGRPAAYALYPNPARAGGQLRLVYQAASGAPMAARALLFDAYGRQLAAHRLPPGPQPELPLGDWPPGLYLLRLETAQGEVLQVERVVLGR
jgi:hypothetical protein